MGHTSLRTWNTANYSRLPCHLNLCEQRVHDTVRQRTKLRILREGVDDFMISYTVCGYAVYEIPYYILSVLQLGFGRLSKEKPSPMIILYDLKLSLLVQ